MARKAEVGSATIVQGAYGGALFAMLKAKRADVAMELEPAVSIAVKSVPSVSRFGGRVFLAIDSASRICCG